jgi:NAD(P)-dependent dehydrogenase (short-subunit alcohol dehydrogenase family)
MFLMVTGAITWALLTAWMFTTFVQFLRERSTFDLQNRWVLVTGCDSGIGLGVVTMLAARKARVIACTYTAEGEQQARSAGAALTLRFDLTAPPQLQAAIENIKTATGGQLWAVVHNAGVVMPGFVEYQVLETYRRVMEVNCFAVVALTQALIPMLKTSQGRVVVVSSVDGLVSLPGNAPYDASKFAVEAYADALRVELSFWKVHVAVVNPATMKTPLAMGFFEAHRTAWERMYQADPQGAWQQAWTRDWLDEYVAVNTKNLASIAQDPIHAVRDIVHAVAAQHPRLRYLSGTLAKTLFFALWKMPESWSLVIKRGTVAPKPII